MPRRDHRAGGPQTSRSDIERIHAGERIQGERTFVRRDGTRFVGEVHSGPIHRDGRVVGVRGVLRDVTARKLAEEKFRESELGFKTLFDLSPQPIAVTELETGRLLDVNRKFCELSGYARDDVTGQPTWGIGIISKEDRSEFAAALAAAGEVRGLPMQFVNRSGTIFETLMFARVIELAGRMVVMTVVMDLTEQRHLEAQLLQARKMESLGKLAGGVAHDFNNTLTVVGGLASLGRLEVERGRAAGDFLRGIEEQVQSASALTRQLLAFAGTAKYDVAPADVCQIVARTSEVFARTHKGVAVDVTCGADVWAADVDRSQIEQMLLNLFVNAAHAMAGGGSLHVATQNATLDASAARACGAREGRYVKLTVRDTGSGMDEATRTRIFEPFFTTKEMGRGTGLGLASVYGVVKNHEGAIDVWSEVGVGTRFDVYLPASRAPASVEPASRDAIRKGRGLVMLVDDEEAVSRVCSAMLRELGYEVLVASSGAEATELFRLRKDEIDLVWLDMVMPGMDGAAVFEELDKIRTGVTVVLVSGHAGAQEAAGGLGGGRCGFLQKPFGLRELSRLLARNAAEAAPG